MAVKSTLAWPSRLPREAILSILEEFSDRPHEHAFGCWRDIGGAWLCFVAALVIGDGSPDVPRCIVAISRHGDELAGALRFGRQLILHEQFARQMQYAGAAQL